MIKCIAIVVVGDKIVEWEEALEWMRRLGLSSSAKIAEYRSIDGKFFNMGCRTEWLYEFEQMLPDREQ